MPTRIDHVIIASPDLDQMEATFTSLGFHVTGGGTHPHLGTRNRIIVLGEGYIELLGVADEERASVTLRARIAAGGGWVGYALQSADIRAEAQAMRARGVDARGPVAGRLVAPDGGQRSWQVVTIGSDDLWAAAIPLPFLIQHDSAGERHQRELAGADGLAPHANGATRLLGVTMRATDDTALRQRYEQVYGLSADSGNSPIFPLGDSGEWIALARMDAQEGKRSIMSVTLAAPNLDALAARAAEAGMATSAQPDALTITLPIADAALGFR